MDDSSSPPPTSAGMYWSVEQCCWLPSLAAVAVPQQREDEPAEEPVAAGP